MKVKRASPTARNKNRDMPPAATSLRDLAKALGLEGRALEASLPRASLP